MSLFLAISKAKIQAGIMGVETPEGKHLRDKLNVYIRLLFSNLQYTL